MKLAILRWLLPVLATAAMIGCANPGPPLPPSLELPKAVTDLRATRKGDKVYLAWTVPTRTADHQAIRHMGPTRICRSAASEITDCSHGVAEISPAQFPVALPAKKKKREQLPKVEASYTDTLPPDLQEQEASAVVTYAVEVFNSHARTAGLSNQVQVPAVPALAPPANFQAQITAGGVDLNWQALPQPPAVPGLSYAIRIYRRAKGGNTDAVAGEVPVDATTFSDHGFEWEKTYDYRATAVTTIQQPGKGEVILEGDDTAAVKVIAHDIFPPAVPSGLQAVATGVGQQPGIDLVWAPDTEPDLAGYNVFRREEGSEATKINAELLKTPSYRDTTAVSGHAYYYSVSAVDVRGNESARSEEAHETMP
jgi:hypothetical protein